MAFRSENLGLLSYTGFGATIAGSLLPRRFKLWAYQSEDLPSEMDTTGYFNEAIGDLEVGNFILTAGGVAGSPSFGLFVVTSNDGTNVDVANISSFGLADTD